MGIQLDSNKMEARLPVDKLTRIIYIYKNYVHTLDGNSCSRIGEELLSMKVFNM